MTIYLAWLIDCWVYCPRLIGVYSTKAGAYRAVRQALYAAIQEHQTRLPYKDMRHDYQFAWKIEPKDVYAGT